MPDIAPGFGEWDDTPPAGALPSDAQLAELRARLTGEDALDTPAQTPEQLLTDEQLRRIAGYVHPDAATEYVRAWLHSMARELLAARERIAELEEAQPAPAGYAVSADMTGVRWVQHSPILSRAEADAFARLYSSSDIRAFELREVAVNA